MLLAIDIGNTNIVVGVFDGRKLMYHWRLATHPAKTSDDYSILLLELLTAAGLQGERISDVVLSSVVPVLTPVFEALSEAQFHRTPLVISPELPTGLTLRYPHPRELGSDRLVNAAAAYARYHSPLIIIDFGTATTFCAVTASGEYLGGAIAPGVGIAAEALASRTAKLPNVELSRPKTAIGIDTVTSIQSGLIFGFAGLVDEMVSRIERELGQKARVIATGGLASVMAQECRTIQELLPFLTLEGLELIHRLSRGDALPPR